jgi:DNA-binding transcriptional ArsR family regulator
LPQSHIFKPLIPKVVLILHPKPTLLPLTTDPPADMPTDSPYSFQFLETATEMLRAVAHPHRLLIVEMLYHQKSMNVTEIYERLGIEQAVASHHLRILKDRGVVQVKRDGKNSNYSLTSDEYFKILEVLNRVV